jgi:4'-phosphopantetheinyl transferase EntD
MVALAMLAEIFPEEVATAVATEAMYHAPLHPEEAACVAEASPKRRREFTAGRACARAALACLGLPAVAIPPAEDRTPRWPEGVVGCGFCAAALARAAAVGGIGLDVETTGRVRSAVLRRIASDAERAALSRLGGGGEDAPDWPSLLFSAKEAVFKCYFPLTRTRLGFRDLAIEFEPPDRSFTARLVRDAAPAALGARVFRGRFASRPGLVATGITMATAPRA